MKANPEVILEGVKKGLGNLNEDTEEEGSDGESSADEDDGGKSEAGTEKDEDGAAVDG